MPINAYWDTPAHDCFIVKVTPPIEWDQFHLQIRDFQKAIAESRRTIDVILLPDDEPPEGGVLSHFRKIIASQPANVRQVIVVLDASSSVQMFARRLASTLQQLFPRKGRIVFVGSLDEARQVRAMSKSAAV